ncbi:hypothetical protein BSL82_05900 [Tardibacter chloracetimidivorans]|uniref:Phage integrase SAM-like domain-containing protein n=1 Tax=Tardibacter chloracetimidivorans TaxID=1921510 RepID=A0A1L3ZZC0_9SPHN|nr:hypothetical protein BSL82_05900 [Tardibacter chloracetimidivorans]
MGNYLATEVDEKASAEAIRHRLAHIVNYLGTLQSADISCDQVDEPWVARFRKWMIARPIVSPTGKTRPRSPATVENSVLQLQAVINAAHARGDARKPAQFRPIAAKQVNRTPRHRADVDQLAAMFRYCIDPAPDAARSPEERQRRIRERQALHRFLIVSVATLARPDAAHDVSLDPRRSQWDATHGVLDLNPRGRRQTRKYRATVWMPYQVRPHLDATKGFFVGPLSVKKSWEAMAAEIGLPGEGEAGMKLVRRSMAQLLRRPDLKVPVEQVELQLGHRRIESTSELYAPFQPDYLPDARRAIETIIDEIEAVVPGAFHRSDTGEKPNVVPIKAAQ